MADIILYHNPRCSKSRETLTLLKEKGYEPKIVEYLKTPPTPKNLKDLLKKLNMTAKELVRRKETLFKTLALETASEDKLIEALCEHPILIERPIVVHKEKAALGRPPEHVLKILS